MTQKTAYQDMANAVRFLSIDGVEQAGSGHPGMPMGMADAVSALFADHMTIDPTCPDFINRDRFVLSAGHGSMLLYSILHLLGYQGMTLDQLRHFRRLGYHTAGHPEYHRDLGIETTTGPLGQGVGNAVGMALGEHLLRLEYGSDLINHHTYVVAGDGCLMEGVAAESISLAGHLKLGHLIVLFDDNRITIDGPTSLSTSDDVLKRFEASGWHTLQVDGQDSGAVSAAIQAAKGDPRPSLIACRTAIGYGAPGKAGHHSAHGSPLGDTEIQGARVALQWPYGPFEIPDSIRALWRAVSERGRRARLAHDSVRASHPKGAMLTNRFKKQDAGTGPSWTQALENHKQTLQQAKKAAATRVSSGQVLDILAPLVPGLIGGSADLTGSNNTKAKSQIAVEPGGYGTYVNYGIREHAMVAAMNGLALYGAFIPYGGTFLAFADYCRPSIRLAALMGLQVTLVMTHDSIGLGEDGPTHQPVEHLASLRAIPNLRVLRPCDGIEVAECWQLALTHTGGPSLLALSRQALPHLRSDQLGITHNQSARGGYILGTWGDGPRSVTLLATGSEVAIAVTAAETLERLGVSSVVVSMPCFELFDQQNETYRQSVLGPVDGVRIAIEAAISMGWEKYLGSRGHFIGMTGFGASAPADDLYEHFGITAAAVATKACQMLGINPQYPNHPASDTQVTRSR